MFALALAFGTAVGLSLGLTGGSIIAVPLLVYGLSLPTRQAVSVQMSRKAARRPGDAA